MEQVLKDSNNRTIGKIRSLANGRMEGRDANGRLKGTFVPKANETRDSIGRVVGRGNLLAALITSSLYV